MKKIIDLAIASVFVLVSLLTIGCINPAIDLPLDELDEGSVSLRLLVPNYDFHNTVSAASVSAKVVSPDSRVIEVYLDGTNVWSGRLQYAEETASNGYFYTSWNTTISVFAGTYTTLRVDLLNKYSGDGGTVLTTGTASNVTITAGGSTNIHVTLVPPAAMFTALTFGANVGGTVNRDSMKFYSFDATANTGYSISVTPGSGAPDFYLFDPTGARPGTELDRDYAYTATGEEIDNEPVGAFATLDTYQVGQTGTYYIGVYGWKVYADYTIAVDVNAGAVARPAPGNPPPPTQVEIHIEDALTALENDDFETALAEFTLAYAEDNTSGLAFAGYNALYLMKLAVDADLVAMARNNLGQPDYPTNMDELFSGQWLQEFVEPGDYYASTMPRFSGQTDLDADGVIDTYERMVAFLEYFLINNADFNTLADTILDKLGDRLDYHVLQIMSMPLDVEMRFTWDMVFDDWETEVVDYEPGDGDHFGWPTDGHGNPIEVVIGRADLMLLASLIKLQEFMIHMGKVYNLNMLNAAGDSILVEYWNTFDPDGGTAPGSYSSDVKPFMTEFLEPRDTWMTDLNAAKAAFLTAMDYIKNALYEIKANPAERAGYFLSSSSEEPGIAGNWAKVVDGMEFGIRVIDETVLSVTDPEADYVLYVPIAAVFSGQFDYYTFGNWPTSIVADESVGVNLGTLFLNPFSFLVELGANGEPIWYQFSDLPATFSAVSDIANPAVPALVFAKIYDLTLNGLVPAETLDFLPRDKTNTRMKLKLEWQDSNYNERWDPGEQIHDAEVHADIEGVIDFFNNNLEFMYPVGATPTFGDPVAFYSFSDSMTASDIPTSVLEDFAPAGDHPQFITALDNANVDFEARPDMLAFLYNTELYIAVPAEVAWHSFAAAGTAATDPDSQAITATGSVWWALLNQTHEENQ